MYELTDKEHDAVLQLMMSTVKLILSRKLKASRDYTFC